MTLDGINKKNKRGDTPLDIAIALNGSPEIIELIRAKGGIAYNNAVIIHNLI